MARKRKHLKLLGMALMSEERYAVEQRKCHESLAKAMGPGGIDTNELKPPLPRSVPIAEDETGRKYVVTEQCNEDLAATVVPAEKYFPEGVTNLTPLSDVQAKPVHRPLNDGHGATTAAIQPPLRRTEQPSRTRKEIAKSKNRAALDNSGDDAAVMAEAHQGLVSRGVPPDLASAILAAGAFQQTPATQAALKNYLAEKNAGLEAGSPLFDKIGAALSANAQSPSESSEESTHSWRGPGKIPVGNQSGPDPNWLRNLPVEWPEGMSLDDLTPSHPEIAPSDDSSLGEFIDPAAFLRSQAEQMLGEVGDQTFNSLLEGGCFPDASGLPISFDPAQIAGDALNSLVDGAMGNLLAITDETPAGEAILKHLGSKHLAELKALATDPSAVKDKLNKTINGPSSSANVPVAWGIPGGAPTAVKVNGRPAARLADICDMKEALDAGPFIQGNPTVISNGMPTVGDGHKAVGLTKAIVGDPKEPSPNVFMGTATVTVAAVFEEAKAAAGSAGGGADGSSGGAADSGTGEFDLSKGTEQESVSTNDFADLNQKYKDAYGEHMPEEAIASDPASNSRILSREEYDRLMELKTEEGVGTGGVHFGDEDGPYNGKIYLPAGASYETYLHELGHFYSNSEFGEVNTFFKEQADSLMELPMGVDRDSYIHQLRNELGFAYLGDHEIEEGFAEYFSQQLATDLGYDASYGGYGTVGRFAKSVIDRVGQDVAEQAFFGGDANAIREVKKEILEQIAAVNKKK